MLRSEPWDSGRGREASHPFYSKAPVLRVQLGSREFCAHCVWEWMESTRASAACMRAYSALGAAR